MKLVYDPNEQTAYGVYFCPECKVEFFGGGKALHKSGCKNIAPWPGGYDNCEFRFGPAQVQHVLEIAKDFTADTPWYGITKNDLKKQFPELLKDENNGC